MFYILDCSQAALCNVFKPRKSDRPQKQKTAYLFLLKYKSSENEKAKIQKRIAVTKEKKGLSIKQMKAESFSIYALLQRQGGHTLLLETTGKVGFVS